MAPERRTATLLAFAQAFERTAMDDALDLFDLLVTDIVRGAHNEREKERLRTLHDLDAAALQLWEAFRSCWTSRLRRRCTHADLCAMPRERLLEAGAEVETLTRPPDDHYYPELVERYRSVRRFLPTLLRTVSFEGTQAGQPMLRPWTFSASSNTNATPTCSRPRSTGSRVRGAVSSNRLASRGGSAGLYTLYPGTLTRATSDAGMSLSHAVSGGAIRGSSCSKVRNGKPCGLRSVARWAVSESPEPALQALAHATR